MAILINDNYSLQACKPFDARYLNICSPWTSVAAVNLGIPTYRYTGLTVNIMGTEYWYGVGVTDGDLVVKDSGIANTGLTLATNGLTKVGNTVKLGGTLSGTTTITDGRVGTAAVGIQYGNDYCSNFTARSLVDAAYVTGKTNVINTVGTIGQVIYRDSTHLVGCANMIYCDCLPSFAFGRTNAVAGADSGSFGGTGSCVSGACSVIIGGISNAISTGNVRAAIIGGNSIKLTGTTYIDTVAVPSLAIMTAPTTCLGDVLTYDTITKKVGKTTLSALGGLTGATNGLYVSGQKVGLGGTLTTTTSIIGNEVLSLGINGNRLGCLQLWSWDNTCIDALSDICMNARSILMSSSGATYTDLRAVTKRGIQYASDYSLTYNSRSLVDKGYVDTIATGLNVHTAANLTTTGTTIGLSGVTVIDGVTTTTGMRILVRNQTNGALNGIYSASTGAWGRTNDYDFSPAGEIRNGDLIPVTNGLTQNNTLWALTTQSPVVSGDTLTFSLFGTVIDVQAGAGIAITQVGGIHTVCVNLGSNSGLNTSSGLVIDGGIAGSGLTLTAGSLCVNAALGGTGASIPVKFNAGCCLVVNCADVTSISGLITGATNGLGVSSQKVCLGGCLAAPTTIDIKCNAFMICGGVGSPFISIIEPAVSTGTLTLSSCKCTSLCGIGTGNTAIVAGRNFSASFGGTGIITDSSTNCLGLQYAADYHTKFVAASLVDKCYVDTLVSTYSGITLCAVTTANNGLTKLGQNVVLGGALTGTTTINGGQTLRINETTLSLSGNTTFGLTYGTGTITNAGGTCGLKYAAYYGATNVAQSIPDAQWVTGCTNAAVANYICNASNGLTKSGKYAVLGGALTGATTINGAQNLRINVTTLDLSGNTSLNLTGTAITLQTTPPTGLITDSVLVWNSVDKQIKTVAGASLGDKNNVYSKIIVTGNTTLTSGSTYVILASAVTTITITLPTAPLTGQVFKIKDACGNALTNNIIVDSGAGRTIDDSRCALINTDYGALELMLGATCKWFSLAFVN